MKALFFLIAFQVLAASLATASEFIVSLYGSPAGRYVADLDNNRLADGNLVLIGSVANESALDGTLPLPAEDLISLIGWETFGSTVTGSIFDNAGKVVGDVINDTPLAEDFSGKQIFIWVFNADTVWGATQYGLFTAYVTEPAWLFPANGGTINQIFISMDEANLVAKLGSVNGMELGLVGVIPEPMSYAAVLALGSLLAVSIRRRRRAR